MKYILILYIGISLLTISCKDTTKKFQEDKPKFDAFAKTIKSDSTETNSLNNNFESQETGIIIPFELEPFVDKGYITHNFLKWDLTYDGLSDYILILGKPIPRLPSGYPDYMDTSMVDSDEMMIVHLIVRQKNNSLKLHTTNKDVLDYSFLVNENYIEIDSASGDFVIWYHSAASTNYGSNFFQRDHFKFIKKEDQWFLNKREKEEELSRPGFIIYNLLEEAKEENPKLTEEQLDSLEENYSKTINDEVHTTKEFPRDFGKIPFSTFKKGEQFEGN